MTISPDEAVEYDAFGPWILPVRDPHEVPRLFRDHPVDLASARMVVKVPRSIARRDADPGMDLYDHLVAAGPERLTVLSRHGTGYTDTTVGYDQIAALTDSVDLLDGRFTVHTLAQGAVSFGYNASSRDTVNGLLASIREPALEAARRAAGPGGPVSVLTAGAARPVPALRELGDADVDLVTFYLNVQAHEPDLVLHAAHGRRSVQPVRTGTATELLHRLRPMVLHGGLVCSGGGELQILGRRYWLMRGRAPVHSLARTVIPLARLGQVTVAEHPRYRDVGIVTLRAGAATFDVPLPEGSAAEHVLTTWQPTAAAAGA